MDNKSKKLALIDKFRKKTKETTFIGDSSVEQDEDVPLDDNNITGKPKKYKRRMGFRLNPKFLHRTRKPFKDKMNREVGERYNKNRKTWKDFKFVEKQWNRVKIEGTKAPKEYLGFICKTDYIFMLTQKYEFKEINKLLNSELRSSLKDFGFNVITDMNSTGSYIQLDSCHLKIFFALRGTTEIICYITPKPKIFQRKKKFLTDGYSFSFDLQSVSLGLFAQHLTNALQLQYNKDTKLFYRPKNVFWYNVDAKYYTLDDIIRMKNNDPLKGKNFPKNKSKSAYQFLKSAAKSPIITKIKLDKEVPKNMWFESMPQTVEDDDQL